MNAKEQIAFYIEQKRLLFTAASDRIWDHPETRFATRYAAELFSGILEDEGFVLEQGIAGMEHAFVATYGQGKPVIGILAEYDALNNVSQIADWPEQKPLVPGGDGHGCGHNLLGTGALAGAVGIKDWMKENGIQGTIKLFGCPAEESGYGKAFMARAGVFDGLDAALTWHPMDTTRAWGLSSLAVYQLYFNFKGVSAHAASAPEKGRSALDAAELMNIGVNFLREHIIDEARIHYAFKDAGGESANVVQATSSLYYFIRAPKQSQVQEIYERVVRVAQGAALMTDTELELVWDSACVNYIPNRTLTAAMHSNLELLTPLQFSEKEVAYMQRYAGELSIQQLTTRMKQNKAAFPKAGEAELKTLSAQPINDRLYPLSFSEQTVGSSDVGDVSWIVPVAQVTVACEPHGTNPHSWQWVANGKSPVAHKGILAAGKAIAMTALDLLTRPELLRQAAEEHRDNLGGEVYRCAIPAEVKPG